MIRLRAPARVSCHGADPGADPGQENMPICRLLRVQHGPFKPPLGKPIPLNPAGEPCEECEECEECSAGAVTGAVTGPPCYGLRSVHAARAARPPRSRPAASPGGWEARGDGEGRGAHTGHSGRVADGGPSSVSQYRAEPWHGVRRPRQASCVVRRRHRLGPGPRRSLRSCVTRSRRL
jgi:hypothetical protein